MTIRLCFPLNRKKGVIFADYKQFCQEIGLPHIEKELPPRPIPPGDPYAPHRHLNSLAAIVKLTSALPATLPGREELREVASRALDAAVADLRLDVHLEEDGLHESTR